MPGERRCGYITLTRALGFGSGVAVSRRKQLRKPRTTTPVEKADETPHG